VAKSGCCDNGTHTVGARNRDVTCFDSTRESTLGMSGVSSRYERAPTARAGSMNTCICAVWYSGMAWMATSSALMSRFAIAEA